MKKSTITLALITAGLVSAPSFAQETEAKNWAGIYGLYHSTDEGKPEPTGQLDDGLVWVLNTVSASMKAGQPEFQLLTLI